MRNLIVLILMVLFVNPAFAAFQGPGVGQPTSPQVGGFSGPTTGTEITTVKAAKSALDDTMVVLTGKIISRVAGSDDKYMFKDNTGEILVDIDHKVFAGRNVTPQNTIRISGEVDKDIMKPTKIDVKYLEILN